MADDTYAPQPDGWHCYGYEIWPDPLPHASYPIRVPDHVTLYVYGNAYELPTVPDGFRALRTQHNRYKCHPPHPRGSK